MNTGSHTRNFLVPTIAVTLLFSSIFPIAWGQPRVAPPQRVSADTASQAIGGPTLITLHAKDAAPLKIFQDLVQQAGLGLDDYSVREQFTETKPISVDFEKQPFWVVVRSLANRLDVDFSIGPAPTWNAERGWTLTLKPGRDAKMQGPAQMRGPFLVIASSVARAVDLTEPEAPPSNQQAVVEFLVLVDPKLSTRGRPQGQGLEVQGDKEGQLKVKELNYTWTHEVESKWPLLWRMKMIVELPDRSVRKIGRVKGTLRGFLVTTKSQVWEVSDILKVKNQAKEAGEARFFLRQVVQEASGRETLYKLTLSSAGAGEEADFGWPARTEHDRLSSLRLLDAQGRGFVPQSSSYESGNFIVKFRSGQRGGPAPVGEPATLRWELPTQVVEVEIPLEFKDLPIPW